MRRIIEIQTTLKEADKIVSKLFEGSEGDTSKLSIFLPIEVEETSEMYKILSTSPEVRSWKFLDNPIEDKKEEGEEETDKIIEFDNFKTYGYLVNWISTFSKLCAIFPSIIPFTTYWKRKFDEFIKEDPHEYGTSSTRKITDVLIESASTNSIDLNSKKFWKNLWETKYVDWKGPINSVITDIITYIDYGLFSTQRD